MKNFGEKLKELMELDNITQEELGGKFSPPKSQQLINYWLKKEDPPKKKHVKQLAEILNVPEEHFYRDDPDSTHFDLIYNKKLNEIDDYGILSELIVDSDEFQKRYNISDEIKELFEDEDFVESMKITGEEFQILLILSQRFAHRFKKESYVEALRDIKEFLSKRPGYFKK